VMPCGRRSGCDGAAVREFAFCSGDRADGLRRGFRLVYGRVAVGGSGSSARHSRQFIATIGALTRYNEVWNGRSVFA
jgi:hypothetical protein